MAEAGADFMYGVHALQRQGPLTRRASAAIAIVALAGLLAARAQGASQPAPGFTLELLDGQSLSLADLAGSPVILLFWAPW
jgi:cytochrome oxidase Cu insertion factor (SCO1/SenC/PrrC family)